MGRIQLRSFFIFFIFIYFFKWSTLKLLNIYEITFASYLRNFPYSLNIMNSIIYVILIKILGSWRSISVSLLVMLRLLPSYFWDFAYLKTIINRLFPKVCLLKAWALWADAVWEDQGNIYMYIFSLWCRRFPLLDN